MASRTGRRVSATFRSSIFEPAKITENVLSPRYVQSPPPQEEYEMRSPGLQRTSLARRSFQDSNIFGYKSAEDITVQDACRRTPLPIELSAHKPDRNTDTFKSQVFAGVDKIIAKGLKFQVSLFFHPAQPLLTHNRKKQLQNQFQNKRDDILCQDMQDREYRLKRAVLPEYQPTYDRCGSRERYNRDMFGVYSTRVSSPLTPSRNAQREKENNEKTTAKKRKSVQSKQSEKGLVNFQQKIMETPERQLVECFETVEANPQEHSVQKFRHSAIKSDNTTRVSSMDPEIILHPPSPQKLPESFIYGRGSIADEQEIRGQLKKLNHTKSCRQFGYFGEGTDTLTREDIQRLSKASALDTHKYVGKPVNKRAAAIQHRSEMGENEDPGDFEGQRKSRQKIQTAYRNGFRGDFKQENESDRMLLDVELEKEGGLLTAENLKKFLKGEHIIKIESSSDLFTGHQKGRARLKIRAQKEREPEIKEKLKRAGYRVKDHKLKEVRKNSVPLVSGLSWDSLALQNVPRLREVNEDKKFARTLKRNVSHISVVGTDAKKMRSLYEEQSQKSALKRRHEAKQGRLELSQSIESWGRVKSQNGNSTAMLNRSSLSTSSGLLRTTKSYRHKMRV